MPRCTTNDLPPGLTLRCASSPRFAVRRGEAAASVGVSETKFDHWVETGRMPKGRKIDGVRLWDVDELFRAWVALRDGDGIASENNPFDKVVA